MLLSSLRLACALLVVLTGRGAYSQNSQNSSNPSAPPDSGDSNADSAPQNVPLYLSNLTSTLGGREPAGAGSGVVVNPPPKVPLRRNASETVSAAASASAYGQTPASVFATYNSQHNVQELVRHVESRLRSIRTVEMRVAMIQEIFDSLHFSGASMAGGGKDAADNQMKTAAAELQQDLQEFSKRLAKKLQRATHVVQELRDFFRLNITRLLLHRRDADGDGDDDDTEADADADDDDVDETDFDLELDEQDGVEPSAESLQRLELHLNTFVQPCQDAYDEAEESRQPASHYNRQQIQILNHLKTERSMAAPEERPSPLGGNNYFEAHGHERYVAANAYIVAKIQRLRSSLARTADVVELGGAARTRNGGGPSPPRYAGNHLKHIYFLSRSDHASDQSERYYYDLHLRHLYAAAIKSKYVFLLLDIGSAMNAELLELTKSYVANMLQLLSPSDFISVVTVCDEAKPLLLEAYAGDAGFYAATRDHKEELLSYVNGLGVARALTNHSLAFEFAFEMLHSLQNASLWTEQSPIQFVYLTRGLLLPNLSEARHVLAVIADGQRSLRQPIAINTCAVVLDEKRIMYEKQFLTDISTQNYTGRNNDDDDKNSRKAVGKFFVLTKMHPDTLVRASTAVFEQAFEPRYLQANLQLHPPVVDGNSKEAIVSITHAVPPYGVVGVDLYLADLIEDVVDYRQRSPPPAHKQEHSYGFLVDRAGLTIAHPAFPRPSTQAQTPYPVDIGYLENATDFAGIRRKMLSTEAGSASTTVYLEGQKRSEIMERLYQWESILGMYVLCLVSTSARRELPPLAAAQTNASNEHKTTPMQLLPLQHFTLKDNHNNNNNVPHYPQSGGYDETLPSMELLYHRLDLMPPPGTRLCRYFRQIATLDKATLFLSSAAFESPFAFVHNNRQSSPQAQQRTVESIMGYLKDTTGVLANPGLRPQIRHEVNALYSGMQQLKKRHLDARGTLRDYIVRRYIATVNGVLQVYPGCLLSGDYDATRRPWFRKAMQHPGKIVTTEPYLDAGGAGYIITIAHTIFEGKANALHSVERDQAVAIVALDLPYAYFYKLILDSPSVCQQGAGGTGSGSSSGGGNVKCLLFENAGYLIAHPSMLEVSSALRNQRRPHEHLTHKESYLANDILYHKALVRKLACANYQNRTLQRHYVFNTSLGGDILTNVVPGERTKYAIALVRGTNIFAAVLKSTCDGGAFCPCSTIDRICLNCNRMDAHDCECPCECPMDLENFAGDDSGMSPAAVAAAATAVEHLESEAQPFSNYTQQYDYCEPPSEQFVALPSDAGDFSGLHSCSAINCDVYGAHGECLAVMGCEWCQQDLDGNTFSAPFCTAQASCFNGVLASLTPYGDLDDLDIVAAHGYNPGQKPNSYSAFGPVGGAIVVLAVVIGFAIYCYRHNLDTQAQDQFYIDSLQEENYGLPLSRFNFDDCQALNDEPPSRNGAYDHPSAQRQLMHAADISPYHVSTASSYRRPPNGESDHGYSTMTPHEDSSDHQCFTLAEPLLLNSDKRNSKSDTMSISTSISSPTNRQQQSQSQSQYPNAYLGGQTTISPAALSAKEATTRYNLTSPKKHHASPARVYAQTTLPLVGDSQCGADSATALQSSPHYILAPVTVHRHMETSES